MAVRVGKLEIQVLRSPLRRHLKTVVARGKTVLHLPDLREVRIGTSRRGGGSPGCSLVDVEKAIQVNANVSYIGDRDSVGCSNLLLYAGVPLFAVRRLCVRCGRVERRSSQCIGSGAGVHETVRDPVESLGAVR